MTTAVAQALATGLPVITTRHSGLPDQVKDGKNGFLVDEGDYEALAEKILYYMDHPEAWGEFGRWGKDHVFKTYDSGELIDKQVDLYNKLINDGE